MRDIAVARVRSWHDGAAATIRNGFERAVILQGESWATNEGENRGRSGSSVRGKGGQIGGNFWRDRWGRWRRRGSTRNSGGSVPFRVRAGRSRKRLRRLHRAA